MAIDFHTALINLRKGYKKNLPEMLALQRREYPDFVFKRGLKTLRDEIPVFTFHSVEALRFETQMRYLARNSYQTLSADDVYECLTGQKNIPERSLCLTFDDGWGSLWSVAYPLLKKYKFRAVCFLVPGLISGSYQKDPDPEGLADREAGSKKVLEREESSEALCTWTEVQKMHEDGIVDFQSHGMYHSLIYTSSKIVDFINPLYDFYKENLNVPLIREDGTDNISREINLGTPIYEFDSRLSGKKRYFDDMGLRKACIGYVAMKGKHQFFKHFNWRSQLRDVVRWYRERNSEDVHIESDEEMKGNIFFELTQSKKMIENRLGNKSVRHFCFPWWISSPVATKLSQEAGYVSNYVGIVKERKTVNRCGTNPFRIGRLLSDDYILRLPGDGREQFIQLLHERGRTALKSICKKLLDKRETDAVA